MKISIVSGPSVLSSGGVERKDGIKGAFLHVMIKVCRHTDCVAMCKNQYN